LNTIYDDWFKKKWNGVIDEEKNTVIIVVSTEINQFFFDETNEFRVAGKISYYLYVHRCLSGYCTAATFYSLKHEDIA